MRRNRAPAAAPMCTQHGPIGYSEPAAMQPRGLGGQADELHSAGSAVRAMGLRHDWRTVSNPDGQLYRACAACGKERPLGGAMRSARDCW